MRAPRAHWPHGKASEHSHAERETAPGDPEAQRLLELQRTAGNAAVARLIAATTAPRRLARQVDAPEDEAVPLDQAGAAGSSSTLSLADIGSGLAVESYSLHPPGATGGGELKEVSITRRLDKHSATIQRRAATGERIASAEMVAKRGSGAFVFKMSEVLVSSYTVGSRDESETFTLNFAESSFEKR